MTKQGLKAIEEIKVGDQVLSYNDNLEIFEYKDVVELQTNETTELCHIYTETEEIICTPNHSVLTIDGWKEAKELTNKDLIKTSIGYIKVLSIKLEQLEEKQSVYNFNVLGYHTYVVGNDLLVVHNKCVKLDADKIKKEFKLDRSKFHKIKKEIIEDAKLPKNFGSNPDIYYDNKTFDLFLKSRKNEITDLYKTGFKLFDYID